jgi:hypothetical protein
MPLFRIALFAQLAWFVMAAAYNSFSLLAISRTGIGFAGDQPATVSAMIAVAVFTAVTLCGLKGWLIAYRILAPLVTVMLFVGGVLKHLNAGPEHYASDLAWTLAIAINVFGVVAYAVGSAASFRRSALHTPDQ